jgi:hypothetical protein
MTYFTSGAAILLIACTTSCASDNSSAGRGMSGGDASVGEKHAFRVQAMDPSRRISDQDCRQALNPDGGNLRCR